MEHILLINLYARLVEWVNSIEIAAHRAGAHVEIHKVTKAIGIHVIEGDDNVWHAAGFAMGLEGSFHGLLRDIAEGLAV